MAFADSMSANRSYTLTPVASSIGFKYSVGMFDRKCHIPIVLMLTPRRDANAARPPSNPLSARCKARMGIASSVVVHLA